MKKTSINHGRDDEMTTCAPPTNLPGIDVAEALDRFSGNWGIFLNLMKYFIKSHESAIHELHILISAPEVNFESITALAHKIKGGAANLSAIHLKQCASKLEESSNFNDYNAVKNNILKLEESFSNLHSVINTL